MLLIIGGFDPTAKAGILADASIASKIGVSFRCCMSTNTIQTDDSFGGQFPADPEVFRAQLEALLESVSFTGVKMGFLADIGLAKTACELIGKYQIRNIVVDPVVVGKRTDRVLVSDELLDFYIQEIFPIADVVKPNWSEACVLTGCEGSLSKEIWTPESVENKARTLSAMGKCNVLISGRSSNDKNSDCLLYYKTQELQWFEGRTFNFDRPVVGLGCRFSTAIVSYLLQGAKLNDAVKNAKSLIGEYMSLISN